jgi:hypothetical protein
MYRVRFHLANGQHFKHWQIVHPDGSKTYHDPATTRLWMIDACLHNRRAAALRIFGGADKTVCAWVSCDHVYIDEASPDAVPESVIAGLLCQQAEAVSYDPRVAPHWRDEAGNDIDDENFDRITTRGQQCYAWNPCCSLG